MLPPIHVIDFEGSRGSGVVEFGVATVRDGRVVETRSRLCRAVGRIDWAEARVHGIREEEAAEHPPFADEWERFVALRRQGLFCAHNAKYEHGLLKQQWAYPPRCPDFARGAGEIADWGPWLDTVPLCRAAFPALESLKLSAAIDALDLRDSVEALAAEHCPEGRSRYHCALYDALASALLLIEVLRHPSAVERGVAWLASQSNAAGSQPTQLNLF